MASSPVNGAEHRDSRQTVIGLFDDHIDAEQALLALRKATGQPEQVSLVVRDREAEEQGALEHRGDVARVLVATALDAVGGWLQGLASLIVPRRGTFLVAGPIGAALTELPFPHGEHPGGGDGVPDDGDPLRLNLAIQEFGFDADEADYIERRLEAGAALIAVTTPDEGSFRNARRLFAENSAVHIGRAFTDDQLATRLIAVTARSARHTRDSAIVIADSVAPLRHLCQADDSDLKPAPCGATLVDQEGVDFGTIDDILIDDSGSAGGAEPRSRYVVVSFGGVFGLGRRHVPVPAALVNLDLEPPRLTIERASVEGAPSITTGQAFSRHEEEAICEYFDVPCYWEENQPSSA